MVSTPWRGSFILPFKLNARRAELIRVVCARSYQPEWETGFFSTTWFLLEIDCTHVGWPITQSLGLWVCGSRGQQVDVWSVFAIILFMHVHAPKGSLKDVKPGSPNTHKAMQMGTDTPTTVHRLKSIRWLIEHYRSETAYGRMKVEWVRLRGNRRGGKGGWAKCIWSLNW